MKQLLQNKIGIILIIVSCFLTLFFVSNCTTENGSSSSSSSSSSGTTDSSDDDPSVLACEDLSECSSCCTESECRKFCTKAVPKGLGMSLSDCKTMEEEDVNAMKDINDKLEDADDEKLKDISSSEEDMELLCSVVKKDYNYLHDHIKKYNKSDAQKFLGWLAEESTVIDMFEALDEDDAIKIVELLLHRVGGGKTNTPTDETVLKGLTVDVKSESAKDEENPHFLRWMLDGGDDTEDFVKWFHEHIVEEESDGLCKNKNLPNLDLGSTTDKDRQRAACILAVYCHLAPGDTGEYNEFREKMAGLVGDSSDIEDLITDNTRNQGGLSQLGTRITDSDDATESWPRVVCCELSDEWKSGVGTGPLDLHLGIGSLQNNDYCL